jgi:glycosyltransferase involved in cell wall biosynthesis
VFINSNTNLGACKGRNLGTVLASSEILLFIDDDCIPDSKVILSHIDIHEKYDIYCARGKVLPITKDSYKPPHYDLGADVIPMYPNIEGNTSFRANVFYELGGWDDNIHVYHEGSELSIRIYKAYPDYLKQVYSPNSIIYHDYAKSTDADEFRNKQMDISKEYIRQKHYRYDNYIKTWKNYKYEILSSNCDSEKKDKQNCIKDSYSEKQKLLFSICIVTYNRAEMLAEALDTALKQTYQNFEIVIIDDQSIDDTYEVVKKYQSITQENKIRYFYNPNKGLPQARNLYIKNALGEYIFCLDDDDLLYQNILEVYAEKLKNNDLDVIYCNLSWLNVEKNTINNIYITDDYTGQENQIISGQLIDKYKIPQPSSCIRRSKLIEVGGYDEEFSRAQDFELWTRLAGVAKFSKVEDVLYKMRRNHGDNVSSNSGGYKDTSFESLAIKKTLSRSCMKNAFSYLDWSNENVKIDVFSKIAYGFFRRYDYNSSLKILEMIPYHNYEETYVLYINSLIGVSDFASAIKHLNELYKLTNDDKFIDSASRVYHMSNIYTILKENRELNHEQRLLIEGIKYLLGFYPSMYFYYKAKIQLDAESRFKYYLKYAITNPDSFKKNPCLINGDTFFCQTNEHIERLQKALNRILFKIPTILENTLVAI